MRRLLLALWLACAAWSANAAQSQSITTIDRGELPIEARQTLQLIASGGPFPYSRDGIVFGNFEGRLPAQVRGYYQEYTVPTPGSRDRGARRIISGKAGEAYFSNDHYRSFRKIRE